MKYKLINLKFLTVVITMVLFGACEPNEPAPINNPLNGLTTAIFNPDKKYGTIYDIDGNQYKTIVIGDQTWMAENLRVTRYNNGDSIPNIKGNEDWAAHTEGAYCNYNNTESLDTIATFGRLYNYYAAVDERNIAPKGWHVASVYDWVVLIDYLGGDSVASNHLKEVGTTHWEDSFFSDNSSGFTALPNGDRYLNTYSNSFSAYASYWATQSNEMDMSPFLYLFCFDSLVWRGFNHKSNGYAMRCVKN